MDDPPAHRDMVDLFDIDLPDFDMAEHLKTDEDIALRANPKRERTITINICTR